MRSEVLKAKVCLVGDLAVGKTSLIRRFVLDAFEDRYQTTLGAKVTKKVLQIPMVDEDVEARMDLTIWDIMGQPGFQELLREAYFYGARGVLAVADLTRRSTLIDLAGWIDGVEKVVGRVPVLIAINKADLEDHADYGEKEIRGIAEAYDADFIRTSAKTADGVEEAFQRLGTVVARRQLEGVVGEEE
ncbi:MAG TPA: Rab family GTPase [Thermoplasmata archaeon]|nr:Rab family GTPase [Thermoplasmata archaeon]